MIVQQHCSKYKELSLVLADRIIFEKYRINSTGENIFSLHQNLIHFFKIFSYLLTIKHKKQHCWQDL